MELPLELKEELEKEIQSASIKELKQCAQKVSERYREDSKIKTKNKLINSKEEALAYAISRMPATYGLYSYSFREYNKNSKYRYSKRFRYWSWNRLCRVGNS